MEYCLRRRERSEAPHMDDPSTTTATLDKAGDEILTYTVSDEALEAAAGTRDTYSLNPCTMYCQSIEWE
jgi:hypothetical protein